MINRILLFPVVALAAVVTALAQDGSSEPVAPVEPPAEVILLDDEEAAADEAPSNADSATEPPAAEEPEPAAMDIVELPSEEETVYEAPTGIPSLDEIDLPSDIGEATMDLPEGGLEDSLVMESQDTIDLDFREPEDIRSVIQSVADLFELNVVIPDELQGEVSLKLRNVTWQQVFDIILEDAGFVYTIDKNIIRIRSRESMINEDVDTQVFVVNFANAQEIQASIQPLVDPARGRIQVDTRSNALIITERPSRFQQIAEILQQLDRPTEQVAIESKFIEVTDRDSKDLGINWQSLSGYTISAGPFERRYDRTADKDQEKSFTYDATRQTIDDTQNLLSGGAFNLTDDSQNNNDIQRISDNETIYGIEESRVDTAVFSADQFAVVLSALEQVTDAKLISNPTIVTLNNTPAEINIGEQFPIPQYTYNQEQGTYEASGFEFKDIGINLSVTPQVNTAGFINLKIEPEVSSRSGTVNFGGAGAAEIPIITVRKTQSTVTIKDNFTLAIGGLVEQNATNSTNKVPILGDLPLIGKAFRSKSKDESRRNLIIFITAKTLNIDEDDWEDVFAPRVIYEMGVSRTDVPGYDPIGEEAELYRQLLDARDERYRRDQSGELRKALEAYRLLEEGESLMEEMQNEVDTEFESTADKKKKRNR